MKEHPNYTCEIFRFRRFHKILALLILLVLSIGWGTYGWIVAGNWKDREAKYHMKWQVLRDSKVTMDDYLAMTNERDRAIKERDLVTTERDTFETLALDYEIVYDIQIELVQDLKAALKECQNMVEDYQERDMPKIGAIKEKK